MKFVLYGPREDVIDDDPDLEYREKQIKTYEELLDYGLVFGKDYTASREFLGIECLAAVLRRRGDRVEVLAAGNEGLRAEQAISRILEAEPDVFGVSLLYDMQFFDGLVVAREVKRRSPRTRVVFGGPLASVIPKLLIETFPFIDYVISGEAELAVMELAEALEGQRPLASVSALCWRDETQGVISSTVRGELPELDSLPFASRDVLASLEARDLPIISAYLYTSRGCEAYCTFCTVPKLVQRGNKWRARDPVRVVDEIEQLVAEYGVGTFYMADDNFLGYGEASRRRLLAFADEIVARKLEISFHAECRVDSMDEEVLTRLRKAGFDQLLLGLESGSDKTLRRWAKGQTAAQNAEAVDLARRFKFDLVPSMILIDWESTSEEVEESVAFIEKLRLYDCAYPLSLVNKLKVHCGTSAGKRYENVHGKPNLPEIDDDASLMQWIKMVSYQGTPIDDPYVEAFWRPLNRQTTRWSILSNELVPQLLLRARKNRNRGALEFIRATSRWRNALGPMLGDLLRFLIDEVRAAEARGEPVPGDLDERAENLVLGKEREIFPEGLDETIRRLELAVVA